MSLTGRSGHSPPRARLAEPAISIAAVNPRNSRRRMPISEPCQRVMILMAIFMAIRAAGNPAIGQRPRVAGAELRCKLEALARVLTFPAVLALALGPCCCGPVLLWPVIFRPRVLAARVLAICVLATWFLRSGLLRQAPVALPASLQ